MNCFIFTEPFTQYRVQVRAITGGGKGDFSDVYPVYTDVAGKNQINTKIEQKANVFHQINCKVALLRKCLRLHVYVYVRSLS